MYDSAVLGNADSVDESFRAIFLVWDSFPSGYFNHNANELDSDGRNVKDYAFHADPADFNSTDIAALINSNCLGDQDDT